MESRTDQEWVRQLKQNDQSAIADLWEMVFQFAWRAARSRQQPEDMGRDAALAAYNRIRQRGIYQYQFSCPFPGYCRVIVVRELFRVLGKLDTHTVQISEITEETVGNSDSLPLANHAIIKQRLQPCLDHLKKNARQVIELLYFAGLDPASAADKLGINRNYVNQLAHRARNQLKHCLETRGYLTTSDVLGL
ncbi:MAG: sigma-70 family RNA polymerase sigma factor [Chloroflexi bacterium]|nr:sigma-70 family RNA polymerase sigma factor [Chloroflexota bacterium]